MNLTKKVIEIDNQYCLFFDMESILAYKEVNKSFMEGYNKLIKFDDEEVVNFIGCTLRDKKNNNKPVGIKFVQENPLNFLIQFGFLAITLVLDGFETDDKDSEKKKN